MDIRKEIYAKISGQFIEDVVLEAGGYPVEDEFTGKRCEELYGRVYEANRRVCKRLNKAEEEDEDVEIIIDSLCEIAEIIAMKMFDYGVLSAKTVGKNVGD